MADLLGDNGEATAVTPDKSISLARDNNRVYDQIEAAAGYHSPAIYANLLSYYTTTSLQDDPSAQGFIPLTATRPNTKQFIVGVIPPSANVTGRHLDRSASVASVQGGGSSIPDNTASGSTGSSIRDKALEACRRVVPSKYPDPKFQEMTGGNYNPGDGKSSSCGFLCSYVLQQIGVSDKRILNRDDPNTGNKYVPGANISKLVNGGRKLGAFKTVQDDGPPKPGDIVFISDGTPTTKADPGTVGSPGSEHVLVYGGGDNTWTTFDGGNPSADATSENKRSVRDGAVSTFKGSRNIIGYISLDALPIDDAPGNTPEDTSAGWLAGGSNNAKAAAKEADKTAETDLNKTELGQKFQAAQEAEIRATQNLLDKMANTPPLRMLVNPQSFRVSADKVISDGSFTRRGPIVEHWGDGQDKIEGSGQVAGFFAIDSSNPVGPGLNRTARSQSASYQNLLSLWMLYRNNAGLHLLDQSSQNLLGGNSTQLSLVGSIYIFYDGIMYIGSFDTFTMTEDETKPFSLEYSFAFTVRAFFLLDRTPDPQLSYGYKPVVASNNLQFGSNLADSSDSSNQTPGLQTALGQASTSTTNPQAKQAIDNKIVKIGS